MFVNIHNCFEYEVNTTTVVQIMTKNKLLAYKINTYSGKIFH